MVRTLVLDRYAREDLDKNHPHYEDFVRNWMPNMVDRAKMYILKEHLPKEKIIPDKCPHMQWGYEHKKFYIIFSGKIFAKPWFLGGLYEDNIEELQAYIRANINIDIPIDVLLDSRISTVDIKQDMLFPHTSILEFYISRMREMVSPQTRKAEGITFKSSIGFDSSIVIRSTCKSVRDTLSIYIKLNEIYANRQKDCGYYESLDDEFVDSIVRNIIRFERRISDAKHLREWLGLDNGETVCLRKIFECPFNIIQAKVEQALGIDWDNPYKTEREKSDKPLDDITDLGLEAIANICGDNLKAINAHLKREYPKCKSLRYTMNKFKDYLKRKNNTKFTCLRDEIIDMLRMNFRMV